MYKIAPTTYITPSHTTQFDLKLPLSCLPSCPLAAVCNTRQLSFRCPSLCLVCSLMSLIFIVSRRNAAVVIKKYAVEYSLCITCVPVTLDTVAFGTFHTSSVNAISWSFVFKPNWSDTLGLLITHCVTEAAVTNRMNSKFYYLIFLYILMAIRFRDNFAITVPEFVKICYKD